VVLVHTQNFRLPIRKAHLGTTSDTRLFSGEKRTSHFKRVTTVCDPTETLADDDDQARRDAGLCKNGSKIRKAVLGSACRNCIVQAKWL
jgi:hypothetical protein